MGATDFGPGRQELAQITYSSPSELGPTESGPKLKNYRQRPDRRRPGLKFTDRLRLKKQVNLLIHSWIVYVSVVIVFLLLGVGGKVPGSRRRRHPKGGARRVGRAQKFALFLSPI